MPNPNDTREGQHGGQDHEQDRRPPDDRRPQRGNPGDDQLKNLPGQGARRSDQGGGPRNPGNGGNKR